MKKILKMFFVTMVLLLLIIVSVKNKPAAQVISYVDEKRSTTVYKYVEVGISSWYGEGFAGRRMANGNKFDYQEVSFAHRVMPINTLIRVTNLENGKSLVGFITDRGPYVKKGDRYTRILDMSKAAAEKLDLIDDGIALVKIEICKSAC